MRTTALLAAAIAVVAFARRASAGDPAAAAERARGEVGGVFARPEFDPLAQADRIPVPEIPEGARSWLRALAETIGDALGSVLKWIGSGLMDVLRWLARGLGKLFGGAGGPAGGALLAPWVGWVLGVAAAGLVAYVVWKIVRASGRDRAARAAAATLVATGAAGDDALAKSPEDWRRSARELAAGGNRRDALRALYLALLASLHRVGAIRYDRTRTNTAYLGDLDRAHPAHAPFAALTRRFDLAWYGGREPAADEVDVATAEADQVLGAYREAARA